MKLATKMLAGFLIVAAMLIVVMAPAVYYGAEMKKVNDDIEGEYQTLNHLYDMQGLLYREYVLILQMLATTDPATVNATLAEVSTIGDSIYAALANVTAHYASVGGDNGAVANLSAAFGDAVGTYDQMTNTSAPLDPAAAMARMQGDLTTMLLGGGPTDQRGIDFLIVHAKDRIADLKDRNASMSSQEMDVLLAGAAATFVLAIVIGVVLNRRITRRVRAITGAAQRVRDGDLSVAVDETGDDEVADLSKSFNQLVLSVRLVAGDMGMVKKGDGAGKKGTR